MASSVSNTRIYFRLDVPLTIITAFQQYWIAPSLDQDPRFIENKEKLPWSVYLGVVGMPSETVYTAWREYAQAKKGDTAFVTAGSGSVG